MDRARGSRRRFAFAIAAFLPLTLIGGCATPPTDPGARAEFDTRNDPVEPANRNVFAADQALDKYALKPVAESYRDHVPVVVQHRLHDFLANLHDPVIEVNDLLQGNFSRGWITFQRFAVNTTVGGLGLFDVAEGWGLPIHNADYGETLAVWGVDDGPYLVLPVLGPSNVRDAVGTGLGFVLDPLAFVGGANALYAGYARGAANGIDDRADQLDTFDALEKSSIDFYAATRSAYRQHRSFEIAQALGKPAAAQPSSVTLGAPELTDP
ncbi:MAG TPA: VacJ family lipoprotein [Stellaceae bacterium]